VPVASTPRQHHKHTLISQNPPQTFPKLKLLPVYFFGRLGDADHTHATASTITLKFLKIWVRDLSKFKTIAGILFSGGWEMPVASISQQPSLPWNFSKPPTDLSKFKTIAGILFPSSCQVTVTSTPRQHHKTHLIFSKPPTDLSKFKTIAGILFLGGWEMPVTSTPRPNTITLKFLKIWVRDLSKFKTIAGILFLEAVECRWHPPHAPPTPPNHSMTWQLRGPQRLLWPVCSAWSRTHHARDLSGGWEMPVTAGRCSFFERPKTLNPCRSSSNGAFYNVPNRYRSFSRVVNSVTQPFDPPHACCAAPSQPFIAKTHLKFLK